MLENDSLTPSYLLLARITEGNLAGEWGAVGGKMERRAGGINLFSRLYIFPPPSHVVVRLFPASVPRHVHAFLTCAVRFDLSDLRPLLSKFPQGCTEPPSSGSKSGSRTSTFRNPNGNHSDGGFGPIHHSATLSTKH